MRDCPQAVLGQMGENNHAPSSPSLFRRRAAIRMSGEIRFASPRTLWTPTAFGVFTVWTTTYERELHAVERWNAECGGWHVCERGRRSPPFSRHLRWGLPGCMARPRPARLGAFGLRMDRGSQYLSYHFTNQVKFCYPAVLRLRDRRPQTSGVESRRFNRHAEGTDHRMGIYPQHRGAAIAAARVEALQCPVDRRKERT